MSKARPNHFDLGSSGCLDKKSTRLQSDFFSLSALVVLTFSPWTDLFAQQPSACDSLQAAWRYYYHEADFDRAQALIAICEDLSALELRGYIACKREKWEEAKTTICDLLKQKPDYASVHKPVPDGFDALVEELKKECGPRPPPPPPSTPYPIIQPETNVLGWLVINLGGGTFILPDDEDNNPELFYLRLGLKYAEFELGAIPVMNLPLNKDNQTKLPASALKIRISPEGGVHALWPGLIFMGRFSHNAFGWAQDKAENEITYSKHLIQFALLFSKSLGPVRLNLGPIYSILDIKRFTTRDTSSKSAGKPGLYAGFHLSLLPSRLMVLASVAPMPTYNVELASGLLQKPDTRHLIIYGIRALPLPNFAIDIGAGWRGYAKEELGDTNKHFFRFGAIIGLSLPEIFRELR